MYEELKTGKRIKKLLLYDLFNTTPTPCLGFRAHLNAACNMQECDDTQFKKKKQINLKNDFVIFCGKMKKMPPETSQRNHTEHFTYSVNQGLKNRN